MADRTNGKTPATNGGTNGAAVNTENTLLKFITCGSVDDGKSTLIGHILYDAKLLYADQKQALELDSRAGSRGGKIDYSLLLDGLMAEREQGITIDVAYRYFNTDKRSFIVADTPGHEEYTRNMAVGASFADLAVILIDAMKGVLTQTRRHARICALMGIAYFVFAVNKMDLAGYSQDAFQTICRQIEILRKELSISNIKIIPVSATEGDNITAISNQMPWYDGGSLLDYLETVRVETGGQEEGFYMPVQRVCRPDRTFRGFQGQIEAGEISIGDSVTVLPSGTEAKIKRVFSGCSEINRAVTGQPVTLEPDREIDISRGCVFVKGTRIVPASRFEATILWMDDAALDGNRSLFVKLGTQTVPGRISRLAYVIDINSGEYRVGETLSKNGIARCELELSMPVIADNFSNHRVLGEFILIDRVTNATSACGVIEKIYAARDTDRSAITPERRAKLLGQTPYFILTDTPEAAVSIERELSDVGLHTTRPDIEEKGVIFAAQLLRDAGLITVFSCQDWEPETVKRLYDITRREWLLDLREHGPDKDRLVYENTVRYLFF